MKPSVLIIYTGGTIGMMANAKTGTYEPFDFKHLTNQIPELHRIGCTIKTIAFEKPVDSADMRPATWVKLATLLKENYHLYNGFVILHGTDTMAYTASALSFMLNNFNKPVILTGSQLPIDTVRTDGKENLITSVEIAAAQNGMLPTVPEVCIYFDAKLLRGNRCKKVNSENFAAFESPNYPALAVAGIRIKYNFAYIMKPNYERIVKTYLKFNNNIALLKLYPGISKAAVKAVFNIEGVKGVVLETFGAGNASLQKWFIKTVEKACERGIFVLNVTQCNGGSVMQGRYGTSLGLKKAGVISGHDISSEAAIAKMMLLCGSDLPKNQIKYYLERSIAGEMTIRKEKLDFL